jgi:hypothetical protein
MKAKYGENWFEQGMDDAALWLEATGGLDHGNIHGLRAVIDKKKVPAASLRPNPANYTVGGQYRTDAEEVQREREALRKEREEWRKEKEALDKERQEYMEAIKREREELRREREQARSSSQWGYGAPHDDVSKKKIILLNFTIF